MRFPVVTTDDLEAYAARNPVRFACCLFLAAIAMRQLLLHAAAAMLGIAARDMALFYDGVPYMHVAETFPRVYGQAERAFPGADKYPALYTMWFPVYPFFIRVADFLFRDLRLSALFVSQAAAGAAVLIFYVLARKVISRPALAASLFCLFPPAWIWTGSLAFVEPIYSCFFLAAMCAAYRGSRKTAALLAAIVVVTQKSGFLVLAVLILDDVWKNGRRDLARLWPYLVSIVPAVLLQVHLFFIFGDPLVTLHAERAAFAGQRLLQLPFQAMITGLFSSEQLYSGLVGLRKTMLIMSCGFYCAVWAWAWPRRDRADRGLWVWLGVVLLFNASLASHPGYQYFPRYLVLAAPAAILLLLEHPWWAAPRDLLPGLAGAIIWVPIVIAIGVAEIFGAVGLMLRIWPPGTFQALARYFGS